MPISLDKLDEIVSAQKAMKGKGVIRLMVDHASQIDFLNTYGAPNGNGDENGKWSVFVKVDGAESESRLGRAYDLGDESNEYG